MTPEMLVEEMARESFLSYSDKCFIDEYEWTCSFPHTLQIRKNAEGKVVTEQELFSRISKAVLRVVLKAIADGEVCEIRGISEVILQPSYQKFLESGA